MNIESIREEIREKLKTTHNYIDIQNIWEPYKNILEQEINSNPKNIEAYCLLAMLIESMSCSEESSLATLEKCYEENKDTFSDKEYAMWATNTTYFIFDEYGHVADHENDENNKNDMNDKYNHEIKKASKLLEEAVRRKSSFYQTYYALGWYYFENKLFEKASEAFHTAYTISKNREHLYCEASCLLKASKYDEGLKILESLYTYPFVEEQFDFQIALTLGFTLALMGKTERASEIAKILLNKEYTEFDCADYQLTDFLYTLGHFEYVVNYYDNNNYVEDVSWRSNYFYSLKMLGKDKEANLKLENLVKEYKENIHKEENNTSWGMFDDDWKTDEDRKEYIAETKETLEGIKKCYSDVFKGNIKPSEDPHYDIYLDCYYIGCPRHSN